MCRRNIIFINWFDVSYLILNLSRCLKQFLLFFLLHQMSICLFRVMASLGRNLVVANTFGSFAMLVVMALGGFILSRGEIWMLFLCYNILWDLCSLTFLRITESIPKWWIWGYWISPLMYAQNAASVNEFLGHSWDKVASSCQPFFLLISPTHHHRMSADKVLDIQSVFKLFFHPSTL